MGKFLINSCSVVLSERNLNNAYAMKINNYVDIARFRQIVKFLLILSKFKK